MLRIASLIKLGVGSSSVDLGFGAVDGSGADDSVTVVETGSGLMMGVLGEKFNEQKNLTAQRRLWGALYSLAYRATLNRVRWVVSMNRA